MPTNVPIIKAALSPSLVRDIGFPLAAFGGSAAVGQSTGFNPVTGTVGALVTHPVESASLAFTTNPFQSLKDNQFNLSRAGLYGARTLIRGVAAGGTLASLSPGGIALSGIQGAARTLAAFGLMPGETTKLGTAFRHARRVGLAGLLSPSESVFEISSSGISKMTIGGHPQVYEINTTGGVTGEDVAKRLKGQFKQPGTVVRRLRHAAGAGVVTAEDINATFVHGKTVLEEIPGKTEKARVITPRYLAGKKPKGLSLKPLTDELSVGRRLVGHSARLGLRMLSMAAWMQLTYQLAKPAVSKLVEGASGLAITTLDMLRSINEPELASYKNMTKFFQGGAATERQRAVQAIYGAKINPANRFMGNEARMYHS